MESFGFGVAILSVTVVITLAIAITALVIAVLNQPAPAPPAPPGPINTALKTAFTFQTSLNDTNEVNITIQKWGRQVTLHAQQATTSTTNPSTGHLLSKVALPTGYRPESGSNSQQFTRAFNDNTQETIPALVVVQDDGFIAIYLNASLAPFTGVTGGVTGVGRWEATYIVP